MQPNPYQSPASASSNAPVHLGPAWGVISAIPLFIYGPVPLLFGAVGLLFVPGILVGGVSIGGDTTLAKIAGWVLFHLAVTAHGCAMVVAATNFIRLRWRRGFYTLAVGVAGPGIAIAGFYLCYFTFGVAK